MTTSSLKKWDVVEHLNTEKDMQLYLDACMEENDPTLTAAALGDIARATAPINTGLSESQQQRFTELNQKRQDETLTDSEHQELLALNEVMEQRNVERMQSLCKLAQLHHVPLTTLMQDLGIRTPPYT